MRSGHETRAGAGLDRVSILVWIKHLEYEKLPTSCSNKFIYYIVEQDNIYTPEIAWVEPLVHACEMYSYHMLHKSTCGSPVKKSKVTPSRILIALLCSKCCIAELPWVGLIRASWTDIPCIYEARMSPALNESSAIWRFKHSELRDGIIFDFYTGLSNIVICVYKAELI